MLVPLHFCSTSFARSNARAPSEEEALPLCDDEVGFLAGWADVVELEWRHRRQEEIKTRCWLSRLADRWVSIVDAKREKEEVGRGGKKVECERLTK